MFVCINLVHQLNIIINIYNINFSFLIKMDETLIYIFIQFFELTIVNF